jgi:hypothetical protein
MKIGIAAAFRRSAKNRQTTKFRAEFHTIENWTVTFASRGISTFQGAIHEESRVRFYDRFDGR